MKYCSIMHPKLSVDFEEAIMRGVASDGHLFIPTALPLLSSHFLHQLPRFSLVEIAQHVLSPFIDNIPSHDLHSIIEKTFHFPIPLTQLDQIYLLELFHGPTLAFKDIGARFMAEILAYFLNRKQKKITLLVATSGDTGSAVAHGFYNNPFVDVYILYPSKKISALQEKQMTTLGNNIHAIEVAGTFDDCQQLVKSSLVDPDLKSTLHLTTANSINIGRLLPQIVYYFFCIATLLKQNPAAHPLVVVPSGNFGNLTAAAYAVKLGAPIQQLVAATNKNEVVPEYLKIGLYQPKESISTLSNAMDVGSPNNFARLCAVFNNQYETIKNNIIGMSISDEQTIIQIQETYHKYGIILDPHTAVGVCSANQIKKGSSPIIVAATAHPAKFPEVIKKALGLEMTLPDNLLHLIDKPKESTFMKNDFTIWKEFLIKNSTI